MTGHELPSESASPVPIDNRSAALVRAARLLPVPVFITVAASHVEGLDDPARGWTDDDLDSLGHLLECIHLNRRVQTSIAGAASAGLTSYVCAIVDRDGSTRYQDPAFPVCLSQDWLEGWTGLQSWIDTCRDAPSRSLMCNKGQRSWRLTPFGSDWLIEITPTSAIDALSPRRAQVARMYMHGSSATSIAEHLGIQPATVRHHVAAIYARLGVRSRAELRRLHGEER